MGSWRYSALDARGASERGLIEAASEVKAIDALVSRNLTPLKVEATAANSSRMVLASLADRVSLLRNLAILFDARVPATEALVVSEAMAPRAQVRRLRTAANALKSGEGLSTSLYLGGLVSDEERAGLAAGEAAGSLSQALSRLADSLTRSSALRSEILSAALYPAVLLVALVGTLAVIFGAVLPALLPIFEDRASDLPFATRALIELHAFWLSWGVTLLISLGLCGFAFFAWLRSARGRLVLHRAMIRSGLWQGIPKLIVGASFARTLSMLLGGGMALVPALERTASALRNTHARLAVSEAAKLVRDGARLGASLRAGDVFPLTVVELIRIGEETGRLPQLSGEAAEIMDQAVRTRLKRLTVLFTPIATLVLGGLVAFLMSGIVGGIMASSAPAAGL